MPVVSVIAPGEDSRYNIHIGHGLLAKAAEYFAPYTGKKAVVVCDENTSRLYGEEFVHQLRTAGLTADSFVLPAGETTKCPEQLLRIYDAFLDAHLTRSDLAIALGGGVIGDITGYAACTFLRGIHFVQVPTTLLAQVDSSVGGKVAVNHPRGKNLLGAFYQPEMVLIDCDTLKTLDERQFGAGLGEVIKYGCISDSDLFRQIEEKGSREALLPVLDHIIATCCRIKARYVEQDPHDHGIRMQLNFGHTLAHALENGMGYGTLLHGEAVCIGMVQAAAWGERLGNTPEGTSDRIRHLLETYGLPVHIPQELTKEKILSVIALDKKASGSVIHTVQLTGIGSCKDVPLTLHQLGELL